jgi:hypothetical protein
MLCVSFAIDLLLFVAFTMAKAAGDMNRRAFLSKTATVIAGGAAFGSTALSYARIIGANDRISLGHIGIGNRGGELTEIAGRLKDSHNVDMTAVCDLWSVHRDKARTANGKYHGREPRAMQHVEELLALKDVGRSVDFHARAFPFGDPEAGSRGGQRRVR